MVQNSKTELCVGVTLEAFASCTSREQSSIKQEDIQLFSKFWVVNLDPLATGFIPLKMVPPMIRSVGSPFDILSVRLRTMRYLCIRQDESRINLFYCETFPKKSDSLSTSLQSLIAQFLQALKHLPAANP